jgi:hypothetical protein
LRSDVSTEYSWRRVTDVMAYWYVWISIKLAWFTTLWRCWLCILHSVASSKSRLLSQPSEQSICRMDAKLTDAEQRMRINGRPCRHAPVDGRRRALAFAFGGSEIVLFSLLENSWPYGCLDNDIIICKTTDFQPVWKLSVWMPWHSNIVKRSHLPSCFRADLFRNVGLVRYVKISQIYSYSRVSVAFPIAAASQWGSFASLFFQRLRKFTWFCVWKQ